MKRDLYAEVSARIVAELEAGAAPWVKPWSATPGANSVGPARLGEAERRVRPAGASGDSMFTRKAYATREAPKRVSNDQPEARERRTFSKTKVRIWFAQGPFPR
jgi:hypothetical protein